MDRTMEIDDKLADGNVWMFSSVTTLVICLLLLFVWRPPAPVDYASKKGTENALLAQREETAEEDPLEEEPETEPTADPHTEEAAEMEVEDQAEPQTTDVESSPSVDTEEAETARETTQRTLELQAPQRPQPRTPQRTTIAPQETPPSSRRPQPNRVAMTRSLAGDSNVDKLDGVRQIPFRFRNNDVALRVARTRRGILVFRAATDSVATRYVTARDRRVEHITQREIDEYSKRMVPLVIDEYQELFLQETKKNGQIALALPVEVDSEIARMQLRKLEEVQATPEMIKAMVLDLDRYGRFVIDVEYRADQFTAYGE